jgi:hypothetical protein
MSQTRLNDEAKNRENQGQAQCRRNVELGRPVASETKRSVHLPHVFLLTSVSRLLKPGVHTEYGFRVPAHPLNQQATTLTLWFDLPPPRRPAADAGVAMSEKNIEESGTRPARSQRSLAKEHWQLLRVSGASPPY